VHQVSFSFIILICFNFSCDFILGPPGPPGNDGLPGGELMNKKATICILFCFFFIVEPGRHGYSGPKGQRGDHGANGPNVSDKNHIFILNFHCICMIDLW
jgi:hypothetical protein